MLDQLKAVFDDNRGVSPVIGVILMVAITVILAAVVGTFVLNLGGDLQQTPQAQMNLDDASDNSPVTISNTPQNVLEINHRGGDTIPEADLRIRVQGPEDASFSDLWTGSTTSTYTYTDSTGTDDATIQLDSSPGEFSVGSTLSVQAAQNTNDAEFDGEWQVQIIHTPSDSILVDRTVSVN